MRKRIDYGRPVPRELILECLEVAVQAPTGGNSQGWQWVIVQDPEKKRHVAELYGKSWARYSTSRGPGYAEDDLRHSQMPKIVSSSQFLADHFHETPAMVIPCIRGRVDKPGVPNQVIAGLYGSILPAAWSFMLAARMRGLGTAWTTLHLRYEKEVAELLGIPYEEYTQAALITVGYFTGDDFKRAERIALEPLVHWDGW